MLCNHSDFDGMSFISELSLSYANTIYMCQCGIMVKLNSNTGKFKKIGPKELKHIITEVLNELSDD